MTHLGATGRPTGRHHRGDHRWTSIQFYRAGKRIHDRAEQLKRGA